MVRAGISKSEKMEQIIHFIISYHISHAVVGVAISMISGAIQYGLPATS